MKDKSNDPTPQRPGSGHVLDAPLVHLDLDALSRQIKTEEAWKAGDRNALTVYKTGGLNIVLVALHEKASLPEHTANGILNVQLLEGALIFETQHERRELRPGQLVCLHERIAHSVIALADSIFLLTLAGPRES